MIINKGLLIECVIDAYNEKMLKTPQEFKLYTNALYQAKMCGKKIDRENLEYKKKQNSLGRCL